MHIEHDGRDGDSWIFAYTNSGERMGRALLRWDGHIWSVWTDERYRRQGVAHAVMREAIDLAIKKNHAAVTLFCENWNEPAKALYQKLGFATDDKAWLYWLPLCPIGPTIPVTED